VASSPSNSNVTRQFPATETVTALEPLSYGRFVKKNREDSISQFIAHKVLWLVNRIKQAWFDETVFC
jgi:hypothetical protein